MHVQDKDGKYHSVAPFQQTTPNLVDFASLMRVQIEYLVSQGCVQILSDLLGESSMVMMALEGIERVLSVGDLRVVRNAIASHSHADQVGATPVPLSILEGGNY